MYLLISRMRSHFRGSLRQPSQTVTSPHHESSSFSTLPTPSYQTQPSGSTIDGNPSLRSHATSTSSDEVSFTSLPAGTGSKAPTLLPSNSLPASQPQSLEVICILCDKPADVQLIPCNHIVLCEEHAKSSKKCPVCRVSCCSRNLLFIVQFTITNFKSCKNYTQ